MEEIKVGEYVRLNDGTIGKYNINKNWINVVETNDKYIGFDIETDIVKHSKNIIDLVEAGDYVNGLEVYKGKVANGEEKLLVGSYMINGMALEVVNIKTIVTKEQFASLEYKI